MRGECSEVRGVHVISFDNTGEARVIVLRQEKRAVGRKFTRLDGEIEGRFGVLPGQNVHRETAENGVVTVVNGCLIRLQPEPTEIEETIEGRDTEGRVTRQSNSPNQERDVQIPLPFDDLVQQSAAQITDLFLVGIG